MKEKDLNKIAAIEKSIAKKYGKQAIINPKSGWTKEKEADFAEQSKKFYSKIRKTKKRKKSDYLENPPCKDCGKDFYFMKVQDEITYYKLGVCFECYIDNYEGKS